MKIAFIGGGNMGEAILAAMLKKRLVLPENIMVSDASETRREHLKAMHEIQVTASNLEAAQGANVIIMAVKPQVLPEVLDDLGGHLKTAQLVLSIIAGAKISTLRNGLKHERIIRSMPNTPAQIGEGMTVWTATPEVTDRQKTTARNILGVMGKEIHVDDEKAIDMATAVSGSGPAYFFLFVEALIDAAVHIGLPPEQAKTMVLQTMRGSALMLEKSGTPPAELRQMVTSKGGTTAEALGVFEEWQCRAMVTKAVAAAYRRARELGGEKVTK
jgi:pyrroline-5-carboxylate reductase